MAEETGYNNHKFNFLLIYMTADNDLSPYAVDVLNRLEKGAVDSGSRYRFWRKESSFRYGRSLYGTGAAFAVYRRKSGRI